MVVITEYFFCRVKIQKLPKYPKLCGLFTFLFMSTGFGHGFWYIQGQPNVDSQQTADLSSSALLYILRLNVSACYDRARYDCHQ